MIENDKLQPLKGLDILNRKPTKGPSIKHVNFSTNAFIGKSKTSSTSESSKTSDSKKKKNKSSKKSNKKSEKTSNDSSNESDTKTTKKEGRNTTNSSTSETEVTSEDTENKTEIPMDAVPKDMNDIMDETNSDILAFLSDMYTQDDYQPDMEEILEDCMEDHDMHCRKDPCHKKIKKCCCDCHQNVDMVECDQGPSSIKQIKAPVGANITIPIYAAASSIPPAQYNSNPLTWPPSGSLYGNDEAIGPRSGRSSRCHHNRSRQLPTFRGDRSQPHCRHQRRKVLNNHNNANYDPHCGEPDQHSDTLNFETEFDYYEDNHVNNSGKDDFLDKTFNSNRLNRIGSPMNWDEIFKLLD